MLLKLSVGMINNTVHESSAGVMPVEEELVNEEIDSKPLPVGETSWAKLFHYQQTSKQMKSSSH